MSNETVVVNPEKNLHANIPAALLVEMERAATDRQITIDELVREAVERLQKRGWREVLAYGERATTVRELSDAGRE